MPLHQQLDRLSRKLRQIEQSADHGELSSAKLAVLRLIKQHNPITMKELAQLQNVALPTLSKIVDDLQRRSLVIRAQSKEDARQRWIVPTQKGIQGLKQAEADNQQFWENMLNDVSDKQRHQLSLSLDLLIEKLSNVNI